MTDLAKPWLDLVTRQPVSGDVSYKTYARVMKVQVATARRHCADLFQRKFTEYMEKSHDVAASREYAETFVFRSRESIEVNKSPYWFLTAAGFEELKTAHMPKRVSWKEELMRDLEPDEFPRLGYTSANKSVER